MAHTAEDKASHASFCETDSSGFIWRKYGEKTVGARKSAVKRAYFRCLCHKAQDPCHAKKRVDRLVASLPGDPPLSVSYIGRHNHKPRVDSEGQGEGDSKGAQGEVDLQRTGFEKLKPEELAREMWRDVMVHIAEAAAVNRSMGGGACNAACSQLCQWCPNCTPPAGHQPRLCVPLELEIAEDSSEELSSEADGLLSTLLEGSDSPCSNSPASPDSPPTTWSPSSSSSVSNESERRVKGIANTGRNVPTKKESQEDVRSLVEKLQQEIKARKQSSFTGLDSTSSDDLPVEWSQGGEASAPSVSLTGAGEMDMDQSDDLLLQFPPLDFADLDADFALLSEECNILDREGLTPAGVFIQ